MAHAVDDVQMGTLNSDKIHNCFRPEFAAYDVCAPDRVTGYIAELRRLADDLRGLHQGLFLGDEAKLRPFKDGRLLVRVLCVFVLCAVRRALLDKRCQSNARGKSLLLAPFVDAATRRRPTTRPTRKQPTTQQTELLDEVPARRARLDGRQLDGPAGRL